ncbi:SDR family NAD(P)-dependent oxidoreductase [Paenibacillus flagellatus]|uniref:3-ketoacyl-ACP reductase n=1 Tax=Paenibacillus flagellatus TaxID=2211139 RepID=A0A2V5KXS2_9BACL|nr:SDR family oxidoreductase [Paenibacillus flagellatus]PYI57307.1 3-ketoacyl-ACP reductase [Paenibacillus flagellatus]
MTTDAYGNEKETDAGSRAETPARNAIVTGGSRGIGREIVRRLAANGYRVVFTYEKEEDAARGLERELRASGRDVFAERCRLTDIGEPDDMLERASRHFGSGPEPFLDVLVNNAGVIDHADIRHTTPEAYDRVMNVNAKGTFFMMQRGEVRMRDGGRIVNISSVGTAWPSPGEAVYAASKAAVEQFGRVASREFGRRGITVNTISPGPTDTDMLRSGVREEDLAGLRHLTALGRLGTPADIADVVLLLVDPRAGWVTGQNIRVDGGLV